MRCNPMSLARPSYSPIEPSALCNIHSKKPRYRVMTMPNTQKGTAQESKAQSPTQTSDAPSPRAWVSPATFFPRWPRLRVGDASLDHLVTPPPQKKSKGRGRGAILGICFGIIYTTCFALLTFKGPDSIPLLGAAGLLAGVEALGLTRHIHFHGSSQSFKGMPGPFCLIQIGNPSRMDGMGIFPCASG